MKQAKNTTCEMHSFHPMNKPFMSTLSKTFEITRKQDCTSGGGFWSKSAYILWAINSGWYSQESPGWNLDWVTLRNLFSSINSKIKLKIILSNILQLQLFTVIAIVYSYLIVRYFSCELRQFLIFPTIRKDTRINAVLEYNW